MTDKPVALASRQIEMEFRSVGVLEGDGGVGEGPENPEKNPVQTYGQIESICLIN